jgi:cell division protein FtsA
MSMNNMVVGLDIGTTKISVIIAESTAEGTANIVGVGYCPSTGMRRGVVVNIDKTTEAIDRAIEEAERMAGVEVASVYAGVAGDHIRSINSKGVIAVSREKGKAHPNEITQRDVDRVIEAAKAVALPMDREVLHVLPQEYIVDDQEGIKDPIGMAGVRLEADVHIITGAVTSAQNIYRCVKRTGISVRDLVLEPLASSYSVLTQDEKELGVGLIDFGGGTTDIAIFYNGSIRHTSVIGFGGEYVTRDIALGLKTPLEQAEIIKLEHGCALESRARNDQVISIPGVGGRSPREVSRGVLASIIQPRVQEIFELALHEIRQSGCYDLLTTGIVLTGGGALLEGVDELAEEVTGLPVKVGRPMGLGGLMKAADSPIHSTAVGLVLYGLAHGDQIDVFRGDDSKVFQKIVRRMKQWFEDFF